MYLEEMQAVLKTACITRRFVPRWDPETEAIDFVSRRPPTFTGGVMKGSSAALLRDGTVNLWTSRKQLALKVARQHGLRWRNLDGEAELVFSPALADEILPQFWIKVKREGRPVTASKLEALKRINAGRSNAPDFA